MRYKHPRDNLTPREHTALKHLANNKDIIILKTDKGNTIVIDNKDEYIQDCLTHLDDTNICNKLPNDPTPYRIDQVTLDTCMLPEKPCTQKFYMLSKMHKDHAQ